MLLDPRCAAYAASCSDNVVGPKNQHIHELRGALCLLLLKERPHEPAQHVRHGTILLTADCAKRDQFVLGDSKNDCFGKRRWISFVHGLVVPVFGVRLSTTVAFGDGPVIKNYVWNDLS